MFRCELCDSFLSLFQLSHLCENCYKIRTIIKCYNSPEILDCLENNFKIEYRAKSAPLPTIPEDETKVGIPTEEFKKELEEKVLNTIHSKKKNNKDRNY
jgi:hypothetical protein